MSSYESVQYMGTIFETLVQFRLIDHDGTTSMLACKLRNHTIIEKDYLRKNNSSFAFFTLIPYAFCLVLSSKFSFNSILRDRQGVST